MFLFSEHKLNNLLKQDKREKLKIRTQMIDYVSYAAMSYGLFFVFLLGCELTVKKLYFSQKAKFYSAILKPVSYDIL